MTEKEMKKLRRRDLLEMLLALQKENDALRKDIAKLEAAAASKTIQISTAGSVAEAALQLNGLFAAAQAACDQYEYNIRKRCDQLEQETRIICDAILANAKDRIGQYEKTNR